VVDGSFSASERKHALRISGFGAERIYLFSSVFPNDLQTAVRLTRKRNPVLVALFSRQYMSYRQFVYDL